MCDVCRFFDVHAGACHLESRLETLELQCRKQRSRPRTGGSVLKHAKAIDLEPVNMCHKPEKTWEIFLVICFVTGCDLVCSGALGCWMVPHIRALNNGKG